MNTFCTGNAPAVVFTDAYNSNGTTFGMNNGTGGVLVFQISNNAACNGTNTDAPLNENEAYGLQPGEASFDICAAIVAGSGINVDAPAGNYGDTVTYTITP